jgi:multidrug resistance protein, MATE family
LSHTASPSRSWGSEAGALLALAGPVIVTGISQVALQVTDVMLVGHLLGPEYFAPMVLATNAYWIPLLIGMGLVLAAAPLIAQERGRRPNSLREPRRTIQQGFWLAGVFGLVSTFGMYHVDSLLAALHQSPAASAGATSFVRAVLWGFIPTLLIVHLRGVITAFERPRAATAIAFVAVFFNAGAGYALVTGSWGLPALGLTGVGAVTAATNVLQCLALLAFISLDKQFRRLRILKGVCRPNWPRLREMLRIGLPISGTLLLEMCLFAAGAFEMGWLGEVALSAHQIAMQCVSVAFTVPLAVGHAATVRIGLAVGEGSLQAARRCGVIALASVACYSAATATIFLAAPEWIVRTLSGAGGAGHAAIMPLSAALLCVAAVFQLFDSSQAVMLGALRGLKDTAVPLLIGAVCYLGLGIGSSLYLGFAAGMGGVGVWIGLAVGLATTASLFVLRFLSLTRVNVPARPDISADRAAGDWLG